MIHKTAHYGGSTAWFSSSPWAPIMGEGSGESATNSTINRTYYQNRVKSSAYKLDAILLNGRSRFVEEVANQRIEAIVPYEEFIFTENEVFHLVWYVQPMVRV